jgi:hypothetical protein
VTKDPAAPHASQARRGPLQRGRQVGGWPRPGEYEFSGTDAATALAWAAEREVELGADWSEVFAVVDRVPGDRGLVRLTPSHLTPSR